jgi:hypothetical protein
MLTTIDNPFDPFTEYDQWLAYDEGKGYNSNGLLARIARTSNDLSSEEEERIIELAIDEIVEQDPLGQYKKATYSEDI